MLSMFPVYAHAQICARAQLCKGFPVSLQHFHKKLFSFSVLAPTSIKVLIFICGERSYNEA